MRSLPANNFPPEQQCLSTPKALQEATDKENEKASEAAALCTPPKDYYESVRPT
jgi:hypothetical protein